jgi:hypothetical protein
MPLYRAVPRDKFNPDVIGRAHATRRVPSNVPFVVDNLWEYLRPEHLPSRRHAIYASPTPELALQNASAAGPLRDRYQACLLEVFREVTESGKASGALYRAAQLSVADARNHPDVFALNKLVTAVLGPDFPDLPLRHRLEVAPLFLPGSSREDLELAAETSPVARRILDMARAVSTFWSETHEPDSASNGEVFLELAPGTAYRLRPL